MRHAINVAGYLCELYFNSRTHKGCDTMREIRELVDGVISIHAPIKDATISMVMSTTAHRGFQFTHP